MSDWGKGVTNNEIGWGQGSSNNIGWGSAYGDSWSGDTDLVGFDPDAAAFFAAIEAAGGTLSSEIKTAWNSFVLREKDNSRYAKIKRLYPYLGGVIDACRIDAITLNSATNNNFVDGDCDSLCGLQGDGITKKLDTSLAADIWQNTNDWQVHLYEIVAESSDNNAFGSISGGNDMVAIRRRNIGTGVSYIYGNNFSTVAQIAGTFASKQSVYGGRFSSTDLTIYENSATATSTTLNTFAFPVTYPISLLARNGASVNYSDAQVSCHMMAEGMSKTDMQNYDTSYKTFLTEIGAI
jgi:hypothetical protein